MFTLTEVMSCPVSLSHAAYRSLLALVLLVHGGLWLSMTTSGPGRRSSLYLDFLHNQAQYRQL